MRVVFVSNFFNHHQEYVSRYFLEHPAVDLYRFVATERMPEERKNMGYKEVHPWFLINYYESEKTIKEAQKLIDDALMC